MGAWIEIEVKEDFNDTIESLLAWERGLKSNILFISFAPCLVAPCVGAWIEIILSGNIGGAIGVAPCVGAWIEICSCSSYYYQGIRRSLRGSVD